MDKKKNSFEWPSGGPTATFYTVSFCLMLEGFMEFQKYVLLHIVS